MIGIKKEGKVHPLDIGTKFQNLMSGRIYMLVDVQKDGQFVTLRSLDPTAFEAVVSRERLQEWFALEGHIRD